MRAAVLIPLAPVVAMLTACGGSEPAEPAETVQRVVYVTRGQVEQLPVPGRPMTAFVAHHEPIPDFRATWPDGALGMNSMSMPFPPADGVSLAGLEIGDKITITFEVRYDLETGAVVDYDMTKFEALPDDTELIFGQTEPVELAEPPAGDS